MRYFRFLIGVSLMLVAFGLQAKSAYADPSQVYVCWGDCTLEFTRGPFSFEGNYIQQVLANEWSSQSASQALYSGAIAIRTFSQRTNNGCGAIQTYIGGIPVEHNIAQHYWLGSGCCSQNSIQSKHSVAVNSTSGKEILRADDGQLACANYTANNGTPTGQGAENPTLSSIPDPVDSNCILFTPCGPNAPLAGLSQNGSHAWELNTPGQHSVRWTWQHILAHYYTKIVFSSGVNSTYVSEANPQYRWAWLNPGDSIVYNGSYGENYYSPVANTPATMTPGSGAYVSFRLHNTGTRTWQSDGLSPNPDRLGYHWLNLDGSTAPSWIDNRTPLPSPGWVAPGGTISLNAWVYAPSVPAITFWSGTW